MTSVITFFKDTAPGTPVSGYGRLYAKTDGKLYFKNDDGTETPLLGTVYANKGDLVFGTGGGSYAALAIGANGTVLLADSSQTDGAAWAPAAFMFKNRLINPDGRVYQRAVAAGADDTYFADRWYLLTQTNTVTPSVLSDSEDGFPKAIRITQSQVTAQRFGFAQIIEGKNCKDLRGKSGVLVPRVRISNSQAVRYAILGWTSTEDAVTSDVVNDWTSGTYTAGNFFLASNVSVLAVGAQTPSANTWTSLAPITAALGSSFNNIVVMVWTEGTAAQNLTLDFDFVQFERGAVATEFERRVEPFESMLCYRYYQTYGAWVGESSAVYQNMTLAVEMRANPTASSSGSGFTNQGPANPKNLLGSVTSRSSYSLTLDSEL